MNSLNFIKNKGNKRILIISGAGLSVESGINPFRFDDGLWEDFQINDVCNIAMLDKKYHVIHSFYNTLRVKMKDAEPNAMHHYIKNLEDIHKDNFLHITSNMDDLYTRIGGTEMKLHGNLKEVIENFSITSNNYSVLDCGYEPYIPKNGVYAKPNVVFIGEYHRYVDGKRMELYEERNKVLQSLTENDTVVVIGSSDTVLKWSNLVASLPCFTININIRKNDMDFLYNERIYKPATKAIPILDGLINDRISGKL